MAQPSPVKKDPKRAIAFSTWLFGLLLYAYPAAFRRAYGSRMLRVFQDSYRATLHRRGRMAPGKFWLHTLFDLLSSACLERWHMLKEKVQAMMERSYTQHFSLRMWVALIATVIAFVVSLVASLNLYVLEDASQYTRVAYSASPVLRFTYDLVYLSALIAGVAIVSIAGYAFIKRVRVVTIGLLILLFLVALGGFGGLIVRQFPTFLTLLVGFLLLASGSFLPGRTVAKRLMRYLGLRTASILGACVSAGSLLLVNVVALVIHTLVLNPVSHALYMQGQIAGTHWNAILIAMCVAFLALLACLVSLGSALRKSGMPKAQV